MKNTKNYGSTIVKNYGWGNIRKMWSVMHSIWHLSLVPKLTQKSDEQRQIGVTAYISQIRPIASEAMSMPIRHSKANYG